MKEKIEKTIEKIRHAERLALAINNDGFWVAFSGGKDSQVLLDLVERAGVKYRAVYNVTTIDPPENVYFIRKFYPRVEFMRPQKTFMKLVEEKGLPTRMKRFCCSKLKENTGEGYVVLTGVRAEESRKRAMYSEVDVMSRRKEHEGRSDYTIDGILENEHRCIRGKDKIMMRPILDWTENDVWRYITEQELPVNPCYKSVGRVGCMFCPFTTNGNMYRYEEKYPRFKNAIIKAVGKYLEKDGANAVFSSGEECYEWWRLGISVEEWRAKKRQLTMFD